MKRFEWAALLPAVVLLKLIPVVGAAPWACAMVDGLFLMLLLVALAPDRRSSPRLFVFCSVLMPVLDWAIGAIHGFWVPFIAVGFLLAAFFWDHNDARLVTRAVWALLSAYLARVLGVTLGYVLLKDMTLWTAIKSVVRNGWFVFAWYAAAVAAASGFFLKRMRRKQN